MDSLNITDVSNTTLTDEDLSTAPKIIGLLVVMWTIFANGVIVVCFLRNQQDIWNSYSRQVFSLSVNDLCLGFACLLITMLAFVPSGVSQALCSVGFYFFFSSQCAVLYNILVICIHRALTIRKRTRFIVNPLYSGIMIFMAWFLSFLVYAFPFYLWRRKSSYSYKCTSLSIFNGKDYTSIVMVASYFIPLMLTNGLYITVAMVIYGHIRKIVPILTPENIHSSESGPRQRSHLKQHWRAFGTIGILLFILNVCTVPLLWILLKRRIMGLWVSRDVRHLAACAFLINSGLNPFVYAGRNRQLREALQVTWNKMFEPRHS